MLCKPITKKAFTFKHYYITLFIGSELYKNIKK